MGRKPRRGMKKVGVVGKILKEAREKLHLQQQKVALLVGVTPAYISKLEKGINPPSAEVCIKLAKTLELDERDLQRRALAEREGVDLVFLLASIQSDPLSMLVPEEAKLVIEWRKLDEYWKGKIVNLMIKVHEILEVLEETNTK